MNISEGIKLPPNVNRDEYVCKLSKSFYGLKQASRVWNLTFSNFLKKYNFVKFEADSSIFKSNYKNHIIYLILFVDDGLILCKNVKILNELINILKSNFEIKVSDPSIFVGVQIKRDRKNKSIFLHQNSYVNKILEKYGMNESHPISIPAEPGLNLAISQFEKDKLINNQNYPYREIIGALLFLSRISRPDITFMVNVLSRYLEGYTIVHWNALLRVLKYLRGTSDYGIIYSGDYKKVFRYFQILILQVIMILDVL